MATRQSFAFEGAAPRQARPAASGVSRGAQVVGGESRGGVVTAGPQTDPGATAGQLGVFFEGLMQPHIERKQQQRFFDGFTKAQAGVAVDELSRSHKRVDGIFGPTGFEEGAQFYTAMTAVDKWQTEMLARSDELMKLDPAEVSKVMADSSQAMMTADPYVNQMVQSKLIESSGPLMQTVAKKRRAWQQTVARDAAFGSWTASADALQQLASAGADLDDPADPQTVALTGQLQSFTGGLLQPHGMADDTYKGLMADFLVTSLQSGNFYAFDAAMEKGALTILSPDDQKKVEDAKERYEKLGLAKATGNHVEELLRIEEKIAKRELTPLEAVAALDAVNAKITRETGIRRRAFDSDELLSKGKTIISMLASDAAKQEEREYQDRVRARERELDRQDKIAEEQAKAEAARTAAGMGKTASYLTAGGDSSVVGMVFKDLYDRGDFGTLAVNFDTERFVPSGLPDIMQAKLTSAAGREFTADVKQGFKEWAALYQASPAAAAAYYGKEHLRLLNMTRLINGGVPVAQAYVRAFAEEDKAKYSGLTLRPSDRREASEAVSKFVSDRQTSRVGNFFGMSRRPMNNSTIQAFTNVVSEAVALGQQNSDLPLDKLVEQYGEAAIANNSIEVYGALGWRNASGTKPLHRILAVPAETVDDILFDEVDERLKAAGYEDGAGGDDYEIIRSSVGGKVVLNVFAPGNKMVHITEDQLRARKNKYAEAERPKPKGHRYNGVNVHRRIPGETGWQRLIRMNREVREGADPVNHFNN